MYDELIKRLRNCTSDTVEDCAGCPYIGGYNGTYCMNGLITEAADAIEQLSNAGSAYGRGWTLGYDAGREESKPRWIPVTERIPFDGGKYLCKIKCSRGEWIEIDYWDGEDWYSTDWNDEKATNVVTHWMPLPEPPEEE